MIMKQNSKQLKLTMNGKRMTGVMLLEVVLAIAVFAFGMLALVQLQGNLTRSSADANTRTVATNIAEEIIENIRGFTQVQPVADPNEWGYLELVDTALTDTIGTVTRGGMEYTVTGEIRDFWRDDVNDTFISTDATDPPVAPVGATGGPAYAAFKLLKIDVAWNTNQEFFVDDANTAVLGSNDITLYEIIPSSPPILGAKIAADINDEGSGLIQDYTPGYNPDIAALDFDGEKLKESTTPVPDIIRSGELTETYFEVVSYNTTSSFLRREEFLTVGCECTLDSSPDSGAGEGGIRPALWNGIEYTAGEFVTKNFGVSANNQQSVFCDVCCRDHHDGSNVNEAGIEAKGLVYDPWTDVRTPPVAITPGTDHDHFTRNDDGSIAVSGDGDVYLEACRLIRKDGFFRVAQDFNQQGLFGIPENYMDNTVEVGEYSDYITEAVADFYENGQSGFKQPGDATIAARFTNPVDGASIAYIPASSGSGTFTNLPTPLGSDTQQLRSRGIYLDYMTTEVSARIAACSDADDATLCVLENFTTALEIYPFFEVQITKLSTWTEAPLNMPVDVTSEAIKSNNAHSRGRADRQPAGVGPTKGRFAIHKGNVGIAATDPISTGDTQAAVLLDMNIETVAGDPMGFDGFSVSGDILSGVGGVRAADVEISFSDVQCGRTPTGYLCNVSNLAVSPTLTVSNYSKANKTLYACSALLSGPLGSGSSTTFNLPIGMTSDLTGANIVIQETPCN